MSKKIESDSIGWVAPGTPARQCCPATVRRGGFWLLPCGPDPCALSLVSNLVESGDYSARTMLTPFLARTSLQHCVSEAISPILKPFNKLRRHSAYRPALPGPSEREKKETGFIPKLFSLFFRRGESESKSIYRFFKIVIFNTAQNCSNLDWPRKMHIFIMRKMSPS